METREEHYASMMQAITRYAPSADLEVIQRAYEYADEKHKNQLRKSGEPYIIHPLAVAEIVAEIGLDTDAITAALLHDCLEDTDASFEEISRMFGETVANLVEGVTKLTRVQYSTMEEQQMENLRKIPSSLGKPRSERMLEGAFNAISREEGNEVGYDTIIASGAHAPILHWMRNTGTVESGELLLIDAGVEVNSLYTADITRTFPTNGKFTDFQKKLYQAVLDSQQAGFEAAKPGATYSDIHHACMRVIAERLHDWGILPVDVEESLSPEGQQHRRWLACGVAHHLGLDVHDCAQARYESYQNAKIRPGMIFTIEPGLYFREDDLLIPPEYRGIGIRIEDDVLMTEDGPEWISAGIPKRIDDVEAWMADMAAEGVKA